MACVPSWTELRLDATKLVQMQRDCNRSVHNLLDFAIPELDKKLSILNGCNRLQPILNSAGTRRDPPEQYYSQQQHSSPPLPETKRQKQEETRPKSVEIPEIYETINPYEQNGFPRPEGLYSGGDLHHHYEQITELQVSDLGDKFSALNTNNLTTRKDETTMQVESLAPNCTPKKSTTPKKSQAFIIPFDKDQTKSKKTLPKKVSMLVDGYSELEKTKPPSKRYLESDLEDLEHLKAPPLTPSEYLKLNRPDMVRNADRRVLHLKKSAERRRYLSAAKTINALEQIRTASRNNNNHRSSDRSSLRSTVSHESVAPNYQVRSKMSEKEMKRLTARVYNKLPEVKKQRTEEVTKHMKVQYYKNKLEYGRKLVENRKHGVINYPLRQNYDDCSMNGSQDSSITSSGDRSSDALRFESY